MAPIDLANPPAIIKPTPPKGWEYKDGVLRKKHKTKKANFLLNPYVLAPGTQELMMVGSIDFATGDYLGIVDRNTSGTSPQKLTFSMWLKRDSFGSGDNLFGHAFEFDDEGSPVQAPGLFADHATTSNELDIEIGNEDTGNPNYKESYSDPIGSDSNWMHLVWLVDTTATNVADRIILYKNNSEITPAATAGVTQNDTFSDLLQDGNDDWYIGALYTESGVLAEWDGHIADFIAVFGQALSPSNFGYDNGGTWSWKDPVITYGPDDFRINPQDDTEIGKDQTGNGYDFTLNGLDSSNFSTDVPPV